MLHLFSEALFFFLLHLFFHGGHLLLVHALRAVGRKQDFQCQKHQLQVQPYGIILNIKQIQLQLVIRRCIVLSVYLRISRKPGLHSGTVCELRHFFYIFADDLRPLRSGTDKGHLAL